MENVLKVYQKNCFPHSYFLISAQRGGRKGTGAFKSIHISYCSSFKKYFFSNFNKTRVERLLNNTPGNHRRKLYVKLVRNIKYYVVVIVQGFTNAGGALSKGGVTEFQGRC